MNLDAQYTKEELEAKVIEMARAANVTYLLLQACNVHPFIEFNGFMQKYVDICRREAAKGNDFTVANTHTGNALPMEEHDVQYLAEKFDCIFGPTFKAYPKLWEYFKECLEVP